MCLLLCVLLDELSCWYVCVSVGNIIAYYTELSSRSIAIPYWNRYFGIVNLL